MYSNKKGEMRVVAGLILLSLIPVVAGIVRMIRMAIGEEITADNARFFASPTPVILHVISAIIFCILGAFQFAPGFRMRKPDWHRMAGKYIFISGIVAALSGLWMTQFYPLTDLQGNLLYWIRMFVGSAMVMFIILSFMAIKKGDVKNHSTWVIRAYAIGQGAGTQALILIPWTLIIGKPGLLTYEVLMGVAWLINSAFAEWIIMRSEMRKVVNLQIASKA